MSFERINVHNDTYLVFKRYCSNYEVNGIINVNRNLNIDASNLEMMKANEKRSIIATKV